jgi:hypothetical protein
MIKYNVNNLLIVSDKKYNVLYHSRLRLCLFLFLSWLFQPKSLRSQKQKQTVNFLTDF